MIEGVFWSSIVFIFYSYLGYPLLLIILSLLRNRRVIKGDIAPRVSFIIAAYNEEKRILEKIENTLWQDYPKDRLDIIVASDCSSDQTDHIVKSHESHGVRLLRSPQRKGKEAAQKMAIEASRGEILIFTDAATMLLPNGVSSIVKNFHDPTVGCVSGVDRFIDPDGKLSGEGAYVKYEMFLRDLESRINTVVGLSGSFFAARREVCQSWSTDHQSDFHTLLNAIKLGLRGVSDQDSVGYYRNIRDQSREFDRKVRTVLRGMTVLMSRSPMLNPFQYGFFSWQLFSHKLCRWLVPFAMILAFSSNALLISKSTIYLASFSVQLALYLVAISSTKYGLFSTKSYLRIPFYFLTVNLSILNAWYKYARGERMVVWNPSER